MASITRRKRLRQVIGTMLIIIAANLASFGQSIGDFRSLNTGTWSNTGTWEVWNGSSYIAATSIPTSSNNVVIRNAKTVTIDVNANCKNVSIGDGSTIGILQFASSGSISLSVGQDLTINASCTFQVQNLSTSSHTATIGGNLINNGSVNLRQTSARLANLTVNGNSISGNGTTFNLNSLTLGLGFANILFSNTININGDLSHTSSLSCTAGTVSFQGGAAQAINGPNATFNQLSIATNATAVTMNENVTVNGLFTFGGSPASLNLNGYHLTMKGGYTRSGTCYFIGNAASNLTFDGASSSTFIFASNFNLNNLTINNTSASASTYTLASALTVNNLSMTGATSQTSLSISGATLTINNSANINSGGILENANSNGSLTANDITIAPSGILRSNTSPTTTRTFTVNVSGNISNAGTINFFNTLSGFNSIGNLSFTGSSDKTFSFASGSVTNLNTVTINKASATLEMILNNTSFSIQNGTSLGFLSITAGTFKLTGNQSLNNPLFSSAAYTIPLGGTFWLNNPNVNITGQNSSASVTGTLRLTQGNMTVGTTDGNSLILNNGSSFVMEGGTLNLACNIRHQSTSAAAISFSQSGGTINVCTVKNSASTSSISLNNASNTINITGGNINIIQKNTNASIISDYNLAGSTINITGGTLTFGTSATATNYNFYARGASPSLIVDNTGTPKSVTITASSGLTVYGDITANAGTTVDFNANTVNMVGSNNQSITNNGTIIGTASNSTLLINKPSGTVTLNGALSVYALNLTSGIINTSTTNLLSVTGTNAITGGNSNSYINGALRKNCAKSTTAQNYLFPVGAGEYSLMSLNATIPSPSTGGYIMVAATAGLPGGSGGTGLTDPLNASRYWTIATESLTINPNYLSLVQSSFDDNPVIGLSSTQTGAYNTIGGQVSGTTITSNKKFNLSSNSSKYVVISEAQTLIGDYYIGNSQPDLNPNRGFYNLTDFSQALNQFKVIGNVTAYIMTDYDGTTANVSYPEKFPIVFQAYPTSSSAYSVKICLANGVSGKETSNSASLSPDTALINLASVTKLIFDGQVKDASGTGLGTIGWTFRMKQNNNNLPSFLFDGDASNNTLTYLSIEGNSQSTVTGTVAMISSSTLNGCDNNSITFCNIRNRSDVVQYPNNAIYSSGPSASVLNNGNSIQNCNIYNFGNDNAISSGINIGSNNAAWTIQNNSFYQTDTRIASTGPMQMTAIKINSGTGNDVSGNYIGGSTSACGGLPWNISSPTLLANKIVGINVTAGSIDINNNTITNIVLDSNSNDYSTTGVFCGISISGSIANIGTTTGNSIGSMTSKDAIKINVQSSGSGSYAIYSQSNGTNIKNNTIGGLSIPAPLPSGSTSLILIRANASSYIGYNTIGGSNTDNIYMGSVNASLYLSGIECTSGSAHTVEYNTIKNFTNYSTNSGNIRGIYGSATASFVIRNNKIFNLKNTNTVSGTGTTTAIVCIGLTNTSSLNHTIIGNEMYQLETTNTGSIEGIFLQTSSASTANSIVKQNKIYGLKIASSSASIIGIYTTSGFYSFQNNMMQLGVDGTGNSITTASTIYGFFAGSVDNCSFNYNSVYIGGSGVSSANSKNTYAFYKTQSSSDDIRNNIFCNARASGAAHNGSKHYAYFISFYTGTMTSDYNIYYVNTASEGVLFNINSSPTDYLSLRELRSDAKNQELHSGVGDPYFENPTGSIANWSLKLSTTHASPAKGTGIIVNSINEDIDGSSDRTGANGSATEIGADADPGSLYTMDNSVDIFTPVFSYLPLGTTTPISGNRTINVSIVDQSPITGGLDTISYKPRIYYRRSYSTNSSSIQAWNTTESSVGRFISGDIRSGIWSFTIDAVSNLYPQSPNDIIEYFFVAQDKAGNIWYSKFDDVQPIFANVNTPSIFPDNVGVDYYAIDGTMPSNVTVGSGGTFASLTNSGGLFQNMNSLTISSNITASIVSNIIEDGAYALNAWNESPSGSNYTLTIVPDGTTTRILTANTLYNKDLIRLDSAQRLTIDGSFNGTGRYLKFVNTKQNYSTLKFSKDASYNAIKNTDFCGGTALIPKGVIWFAEGSALGNDFNTVTNCTVSGAVNTYENAIYSLGTSNAVANGNNTLSGNSLSNYILNGISLQTDGTGDGWNITGNSFFYNTSALPNPVGNTITSIYVVGGGGHTISSNYIGGQSESCNGTPWSYTASVAFNGIYIATTSAAPLSVDGNTIQNINLPSTGAGSFYGIRISSTPLYSVSKNIIGGSKAISSSNIGFNGITLSSSSNGVMINDNTITNITNNNTGTATFNALSLSVGTTTASSLQGNIVQNINQSAGTGAYTFYGISVSGGKIDTGTGNLIGDPLTPKSIRISGSGSFYGFNINNNSATSRGSSITNNKIANISSASTQAHYGFNFNMGTGVWNTISSNSITDISCTGASSSLVCIQCTGDANISNNTIGGSAADLMINKGSGLTKGIALTCNNSASVSNNAILNIRTEGNAPFTAIDLALGASAATIVGDTIRNINIAGSGSSSFTGINVSSGLANVSSNIIGGATANSIQLAGTTASSLIACSSSTTGTTSITGNQLSNIKTTGAASLTGILSAGTSTVNIQNNQMNSISVSSTGASSFTGIGQTAGTGSISGNLLGTLSSISCSGTAPSFGIYTNISAANVFNNRLTNISCSGSSSGQNAGSNQLSGIFASGGTVAGNTINGLTCSHPSAASHLAGIAIASSLANTTVNANKIYGLSNSSTHAAATVNGLILNPSSKIIVASNQFITLGNGASTPIFNGCWINQSAAGTVDLWYNTIYIAGSGSSSASAAVLRDNITTPTDIKNSILINARGNASAYSLANKNAAGISSDYNDLVTPTGGFLAYWGSSGYTTLATWQSSTGKDANSISYFPNFTNTTPVDNCDFHIDPSNNCNLNGMGTVISVTTDYDNETRHVKRPDIGADEFTPTGGNSLSDFWTGINDTKWNEPENWACELLPLSTTDVTIPVVSATSFYPAKNTLQTGSFATAAADCHHLELKAGASLSVLPNQSLTIGGDFTVHGTFTVKSDASGTGSFICRGSTIYGASSAAIAERYFSYWSWHYFTPMTSNVNSSQLTNSTGNYNANLITYDEGWNSDTDKNGTVDYMDGWLFPFKKGSPSATLTPAKGYGIIFEGDNTITMTNGPLNTGNYSVAISNTDATSTGMLAHGFNLVGNPYPSSLNAGDFLSANSGQINGAVYFWDEFGDTGWNPLGSDYAVWNSIGTVSAGTGSGSFIPDGHIAPGQAFFVLKSAQGSGSLNFTNAMREQNGTHFFKSADNLPRVKIGVISPLEQYNETLIAMSPSASDSFDNEFDAPKIKGNTKLSLVSILDKKRLAIQSIAPVDPSSGTDKVIPLGLEVSEGGNYIFKLAQFENIDPQLKVYFIDKKKNKIVSLSSSTPAFYESSLAAGVYDNRFQIVFSTAKPDTKTEEKQTIQIACLSKAIKMNIELENTAPIKGQYSICDEIGRVISVGEVENNSSYTIPIEKHGVYIVKIEIGTEKFIKKITVLE